jgi:hypothetical protein
MEVTDDGGWHAGAEVRIVGLVKTPQHNGKVGIISAKAPGTEGRVGVELGKGKPMAVWRENLELVKAPQANGQAPETGPAVDAGAKAASEAARRELIVAKVAAARAAQAAAEAEVEAEVEAGVEADVLAGVRAVKEAAGREEYAAKVAAAQAIAELAEPQQAAEEAVGEAVGGAQDTPEYVVYAQYNATMNSGGGNKQTAGGGAKAKKKAKAKTAGSAAAAAAAEAAEVAAAEAREAEVAKATAVAKVEATAKAIKEAARLEDYLGKTTLAGLGPSAPTKVATEQSREASVQPPLEPTAVTATPAPTSPTPLAAAGAQEFEAAAAARARVVAARAAAVAERSPRRGSAPRGGTYAWPQLSSPAPSWAAILLGWDRAATQDPSPAPAPAPVPPRREEPTWREMLLNSGPTEPSSPTIADRLKAEEAHMRRTKRCDAVANAALTKAKALLAMQHTAMCVRFVVRLQARAP